MQIVVSVIIPVYNTKEYLRVCVNSVNAQSQIGLEIILVDDGSTDGSGELCDTIAAENRSITHTFVVLHKPNGGLADARNFGMAHAKGKYLLFLDSDDTLLTLDAISGLSSMAQQTEKDVLCYQYTRRADHRPVRPAPYPCSDNVCELVQSTLYTSSACLKLIRADLLKEHGITFVTEQCSEDILFSAKLLAIPGVRIAFLNKVFYFYRVREGSLTNSLRLKNITDTIEILQELMTLATLDPANPPSAKQGAAQPLLAYTSFQYATLLINIHLCRETLPKETLREIYSMKFLLRYHQSTSVRLIALCAKCIGIRATSFLLSIAFRLAQVIGK